MRAAKTSWGTSSSAATSGSFGMLSSVFVYIFAALDSRVTDFAGAALTTGLASAPFALALSAGALVDLAARAGFLAAGA